MVIHRHNHTHHHHETSLLGESAQSLKRIRIAVVLNLGLAVIEIIFGTLFNSVAIVTDAIHDFGDGLSLTLAYFLEKYATKKRDQIFTYGYQRFSLLSSLITGLVIVFGIGVVMYESVGRLFSPEPVNARGMMILSLVGMAFNGAGFFILKKGHGHNEKMVSWHLFEDLLGWMAIFVGSLVLMFWNLPIIDPILSIAISLFIIRGVLLNLREVVKLFLQAIPTEIDFKEVEQILCSFPEIKEAHHVHIWSLDGVNHVLSAHIVVNEKVELADFFRLKCEIKKLLWEKGLRHLTMEFELDGEVCQLDSLVK